MNKFIHRKILPQLTKLLDTQQVIVITGMRRVGKTTLLKHIFSQIESKNKIYLNLENVLKRKIFSQENYDNIKLSLEEEGVNFNKKAYIFIDEIQFIKNIPSVIKYLYDKHDIKFVVTGSSSFYLKNYFTESLAGRKFILHLYPLTFKEFLNFKNIEKKHYKSFVRRNQTKNEIAEGRFKKLYKEYVRFGGFPEVVLAKDSEIKKELLKDIINSYFQIDVTTLAQFKDIGKIRDLLMLLTQRVGQKINITNLSNALKITRNKVYQYLEFLQSTFVINTISQESSIDNKISAENKLYFCDTGLARSLAEISLGSQLENSVYMNLIYDYNLTYYQTSSGGEIDFILDNKIGLEVKQTPNKRDLANLEKRAESAGIEEYFLVGLNYINLENTIMAWDL
jgi:hypothetical protein